MDKHEVIVIVIVGIVFSVCIVVAASVGKVRTAARPCIDAIETKDIEIIRAVCRDVVLPGKE